MCSQLSKASAACLKNKLIHPEALGIAYMDTDSEFTLPSEIDRCSFFSTYQLHSYKAGLTDHVIIQNMLQQESGPSVAPDC